MRVSRRERFAGRGVYRAMCEPLEVRLLLNAPGTNYTLAFDDEFSGTSLSTDANWANYLPWTSNHYEGGQYLDYMVNSNTTINGVNYTSNVAESGGQLHLNTQAVTAFTVNGTSFSYTGAMITTSPTFQTLYGYAEIRAELPTGAGNWPAFWSLGNGWPPENDIMEDWPATSTNHQGLYDMSATWRNVYPAYFAANTFHTYAMKWGPGYEAFYEDGTQTESITSSEVPSEKMYFLLNSGIQSGQVTSYSNSNNNMLNVDYVRIYTYNPGGPAIANAGFNVSGSYSFSGGAGIVTGSTIGLTGTGDLHITATGEADQTVTGLIPDTTYILSGYAEIAAESSPSVGWLAGLIGVKNYTSGSGNISAPIGNTAQSSPVWALGSESFTTGPTDTSATIYLSNPNGAGTAVYFDDLSLITAPVVAVSTAGTAPGTAVSVPITQGVLGSFWSAASITSSNTALVANSGISLNASETALQVTPVAGQQGTTTITLTATNGDLFAGTVSSSFVLTVLPTETLVGDGAADAFRLVRDGAMVDVYVNNTTTTPSSQFNYSSYAINSFTGLTANSSLVIDYSGGDPITPGGISWTGGGVGNISTINMTGSNAAFLTSGSSLRINADVINYSNVPAINLDLGSGSSTLWSSSSAASPIVTVAVDSGSTTTMSGTSGALPSTIILNVASGGTFSFANENASIDQLTGAGIVSLGTGALTVGSANGSSNFAGDLTGSDVLTKVGTGTFTLSGGNFFTGEIDIGTGGNPAGDGNGILRITDTAAVSSASLIYLKDNNASYDLFQIDGTGGNIALPSSLAFHFSANAAGPGGLGANVIENIAGNNSIAGPITFDVGGNGYGFLSDAGSLNLTGAQAITHVIYLRGAGSGALSGNLSSTGALNMTGTGNWTLSGNNSYTGTTTVASGELTLVSSSALGSTSSLSVASGATLALEGTITIPSGETFTVNGAGVGGVGALLNISGNNAWTSSLVLGTSATIGATAGQLTLLTGLTGSALTKVGNGAIALNGTNIYSSSTNVSAGSLELASGSISTPSINVSSGATLTVDSSAVLPATAGLNDGGTATFSNAAQTITTLSGAGVLNLNTTSLTISNGGTFSGAINGSGGVIVTGSTLVLGGANSYSGATSVSAGTLTINGSLTSGTISVAAGAILNAVGSLNSATVLTSNGTTNFGANTGTNGPAARTLASATIGPGGLVTVGSSTFHANRTVLVLGTLTFTGSTGLLDLADNDFILQNGGASGLTQTTTELTEAFNAGTGYWNGAGGITSSAAESNSTFLTTLGVILNNDGAGNPIYGLGAFDGQSPGPNDVLVKYTYYGDADLNGTVNGADYQQIDRGFQSQGTLSDWAYGDFNYDGNVDGSDYALIDNAFNQIGAAEVATPLSEIAGPIPIARVGDKAGVLSTAARKASAFSNGSQIVSQEGDSAFGDDFNDIKRNKTRKVATSVAELLQ